MIEAMAYEEGDAEMGAHFDFALEHIAKIENWQKELVAKEGKPKLDFPKPEMPEAVRALFNEKIEPVLAANLFGSDSKKTINESEAAWKELLSENFAEDDVAQNTGKDFFHHRVDELVHEGALKRNARVDGRAMDQVRSLFAKAGGFSPMLHGTGIFYRGETHVLSVLTLGGPETAQLLEGMEIRGTKRFTHHYNFPAYSVGETGRFGGMNRREMGHGFLAEKALIPIIPAKEKMISDEEQIRESYAVEVARRRYKEGKDIAVQKEERGNWELKQGEPLTFYPDSSFFHFNPVYPDVTIMAGSYPPDAPLTLRAQAVGSNALFSSS
jgi:polyribonucleotide nucleotidyltransferase